MSEEIRSPRNTTNLDTSDMLGVLVGGPDAIESQERAGQAQVLAATTLPTSGSDDPALLEFGFRFGPEVPGDPLFREARLPAGWCRQGSDHAMHSSIIDERGIRRVGVFYKAAFYDRCASMHIVNVGGDVAREFIYGDTPDVSLHELLTDDELDDALASVEDHLQKASDPVVAHIYAERVPRAEALLSAIAERRAARS